MITTDFAVGAPCWIDLGAPDTAVAKAFYGSVFDWTFQPMDSQDDQYGLFLLNGKTVAGLGPLTEPGARSAWMIYFHTTDADDAARIVRQAGGKIRLEPFDIDGEARMAQFTDPQGAEFAVWQPREGRGLSVVDEPGSLMWIELFTTDAASAKEFYGSLFGWTTQDMEMPGGGTYSIISPARGGEERMHGGIVQMGADFFEQHVGRPYFHPVFATADCDATVARIKENRGIVNMGPNDMEGVGRLAVCADPFGADFVALKPNPD